MATPLTPDELATYNALIAAGGLLERAVAGQLAEHGLTPLQFAILANLRGGGPMRMGDLAEAVVHSRSGLTYQIAQLEKQGFVTRSPSAGDDRGVTVTLTEAGRERVGEAFPGHTELVRASFLEGSTPDELATVRSVLERVADRVRAAR